MAAWGLSATGGSGGLIVQHCPEPYLDFASGDRSVTWVTHNPGGGEDFQLRSAVDTAASPIVSRASYAENSARLADWYIGPGAKKIKPPARSRIKAMMHLSEVLGLKGLRQCERAVGSVDPR